VPPAVTITATHRDDATLNASAVVTILPAFGLFLASRPVSVASAPPALVMNRVGGASVSVLAPAPRGATLRISAPVSVQIEPVVLGLAPSSAASGETVSINITGRGLASATSFVFLRNNAVDPAFAVEELVVNADGTAATAHVTVAAAAAAGPRVLQILTPTAASSPAGTGGNVFTVR
jgi:hypothetical protein